MIKYFTWAVTLGIISCQSTGEPKKKDLPQQQQVGNEINSNISDKIELSVLPDVFEQKDTSKTGHYVLKNNLDQELVLSSSFIIEKLTDDKWEPVPLSEMLAFPDITYAIPPKESKEFALALSNILKDKATVKGQYRLVKDVWLYGQDKDKKQLTAEFEIR